MLWETALPPTEQPGACPLWRLPEIARSPLKGLEVLLLPMGHVSCNQYLSLNSGGNSYAGQAPGALSYGMGHRRRPVAQQSI